MIVGASGLQLHTDLDLGGDAVRYTLSGEGVGPVFAIDPLTGDIHALVALDRWDQVPYEGTEHHSNEPQRSSLSNNSIINVADQ